MEEYDKSASLIEKYVQYSYHIDQSFNINIKQSDEPTKQKIMTPSDILSDLSRIIDDFSTISPEHRDGEMVGIMLTVLKDKIAEFSPVALAC